MVSASNFISVDRNLNISPVNGFLPKIAIVPLTCEDSSLPEILITEGSTVREGDIIAKSRGIFTHSSIPGMVEKIEQRQFPNGKQGLCALIRLGGSFSFLGKSLVQKDWRDYEAGTLEYLLKEMGVVNTFSKTIPLYSKIKKIRNSRSGAVVLRLFDDDPSILSESLVSKNFLPQVLEGPAIILKAFGVSSCVIAYSGSEKENLKSELDNLLGENAQIFPDDTRIFCVGLDTRKYPAGKERDIINAVKIASEDENFSSLGKKDLFIDSFTALNAYNAVVLGKSAVSTFLHVTGDCLNAAAFLNVRIGTTFRELVEMCGGFKRKLSKIVINGLLGGVAVSSLDIPVTRGVKSVEFLPESEVRVPSTQSCIRCGACRKICPALLWPGNLYRIAHLENLEDLSKHDKIAIKTAILCSNCSLCNSVCPSRLPLSQTISVLGELNV